MLAIDINAWPRKSTDLGGNKGLIVRMATENAWRATKIQAELMKLGIRVSLATVSRDVPKSKPDPTQQQRWMTFLRGSAKLARDLLSRSHPRDQ